MPLPETIIFGGAFDPPHIGHVQCVTAVKNRFPGCKVKVLPAFEPAQSAGQSKKTAASYDDRMQLCLLAFGDEVEVSDFEASLPRPKLHIKHHQQIQRVQQPALSVPDRPRPAHQFPEVARTTRSASHLRPDCRPAR